MSDVDILLQRANVLLEQNRNKEAIRELQQVLGREPNNHYAFSLIARCHYNQRKFDEGIAAAQQAISLSPSEDYYYYLLKGILHCFHCSISLSHLIQRGRSCIQARNIFRID